MPLASIKIAGADCTVTNLDGTDYVDVLQVAAGPARLYKLSFSPLAAGTDADAWIFNEAAGSSSSAAPVATRVIPGGFCDTWDFGPDGSLFDQGIYIALSSTLPTDGTTTVTAAGSNKFIIKAEYRLL